MANFHVTRRDRNNSNSPATLWRTWDSFATDFDTFFEDVERALGNGNRSLSKLSDERNPFIPAAEVHENDKNFELSFDMPGFKQDDLNIELNGKTLTVTGRRERRTTDDKLHHSEKYYGEYRRAFTLPENVKADQIEASYENGVLLIQLPKAQIEQAKKIQIGAKKSSPVQNINGAFKTDSKAQSGQEASMSH